MQDNIFGFLWSQVWHLPILIVYGVGLAFAFEGKRRGSYLALARWGFALLILNWILSTGFQYTMYAHSFAGGMPSYAMRTMYFSGLSSILSLAGMILLIAAIFATRDRPQ